MNIDTLEKMGEELAKKLDVIEAKFMNLQVKNLILIHQNN